VDKTIWKLTGPREGAISEVLWTTAAGHHHQPPSRSLWNWNWTTTMSRQSPRFLVLLRILFPFPRFHSLLSTSSIAPAPFTLQSPSPPHGPGRGRGALREWGPAAQPDVTPIAPFSVHGTAGEQTGRQVLLPWSGEELRPGEIDAGVERGVH
jgi:hypothetical protein